MKKFLLAIVWVIALAIAFVIVKVAKIGPVILTISAEHGWGVHTGDFLALIPLLIATITSWFLIKKK